MKEKLNNLHYNKLDSRNSYSPTNNTISNNQSNRMRHKSYRKNKKTNDEKNEKDEKEKINENNEDDLDNDSLEEDTSEMVDNKLKVILKKRVFAIGIIFTIFIILLLLMMIFIMDYILNARFLPFNNTNSFTSSINGNKLTYVTNYNSENRSDEEIFYKELENVQEKYLEVFNVNIDIDYIIGVLMYDNNPLTYFEDMNGINSFIGNTSSRSLRYENIDYNSAMKQINLLASYQVQTEIYKYENSEYYTDPSLSVGNYKREIAKNDLNTFPEWYKDMYDSEEIKKESNTLYHYGNYTSKTIYSVDYEKEGIFYWNLVDEGFLEQYYYYNFEDGMNDEEKEEIKIRLVNEIYAFVKEAKERRKLSTNIISTNLEVELLQCLPEDKLLNEDTNYPSTVPFKTYVMGVMIAEMGVSYATDPQYLMTQQAFAVIVQNVALRGTLKDNTSVIRLKSGDCKQVFCHPYEGCHYLVTWDRSDSGAKNLSTCFIGPLDKYYGGNINDNGYNGKYYWKKPLNSEQLNYLEEVVDSVLGIVMVNSEDKVLNVHFNSRITTPGQETNGTNVTYLYDYDGINSYEDILKPWFTDYTLKNILENQYSTNIKFYNGGIAVNEKYNYEQTSYQENFCNTNMTIAVAGCGTTSAAIAVSTLLNQEHNPIELTKLALEKKECGFSGTNPEFFEKVADNYNLSYYDVKKSTNGYSDIDLNKIIYDISNGNSIVIAHMGPGTFTSGGHYITLVESKTDGSVLVKDPNGKLKDKYYKFDTIVAESHGFYVLSR